MNQLSYQVTEWSDELEKIRTVQGTFIYVHWLDIEIRRWAEKGTSDCWIERRPGVPSHVAMFTSDCRMIDLTLGE